MTKPVIVTRANKGAPLTRTELDNNFNNLDNASINLAGDSGSLTGNLNDTFNINGGNGIGTAVTDNKLVVNLNGVYGGDSTSSTTVGNNTAVLLATVATSGSYNDLTNKPSSGVQMAVYEHASPGWAQYNSRWVLDVFYGTPTVAYNPNSLITTSVDSIPGRFQINAAGTYLIQTTGNLFTYQQTAFGFYDITADSNLFTMYGGYVHGQNDSGQNEWTVPPLTKVVTITSANKYEWYSSAGQSGSIAGMGSLIITKLA
jgi:hypothetical protein